MCWVAAPIQAAIPAARPASVTIAVLMTSRATRQAGGRGIDRDLIGTVRCRQAPGTDSWHRDSAEDLRVVSNKSERGSGVETLVDLAVADAVDARPAQAAVRNDER